MRCKVYFRADGSTTIGFGHLVRCLALAQMLEKEFNSKFFFKQAPQSITESICNKGFEVHEIAEEEDFLQLLTGKEIVVLDHYGLGSDYQKAIKAKGNLLVCIDDLHNKKFFADLIINHNPGVVPGNFNAQPIAKFALGLGFALLRPVFLDAAAAKKMPSAAENAFVCFGGADPLNLAEQSLQVLMDFNRFKKIIVVTSEEKAKSESITALAASDARIQVLYDLDEHEMSGLLLASGLAIVPSSSLLIEAIACGPALITCYFADNQKLFHDSMLTSGITSLGKADKNFQDKLRSTIQNFVPADLTVYREQIAMSNQNHLKQFTVLCNGKI